jgi:hypothetical protein
MPHEAHIHLLLLMIASETAVSERGLPRIPDVRVRRGWEDRAARVGETM